MKKLKLILASLLFLTPLLMTAGAAQAVDVLAPVCNGNYSTKDAPQVCKDNNTNGSNPIVGPNGILTKFVKILSYFVAVAAIFVIIVAGIKFIISSGDPQGVKSAKDTIIYAVIGLGVAAIAQALVLFVLNKVG